MTRPPPPRVEGLLLSDTLHLLHVPLYLFPRCSAVVPLDFPAAGSSLRRRAESWSAADEKPTAVHANCNYTPAGPCHSELDVSNPAVNLLNIVNIHP